MKLLVKPCGVFSSHLSEWIPNSLDQDQNTKYTHIKKKKKKVRETLQLSLNYISIYVCICMYVCTSYILVWAYKHINRWKTKRTTIRQQKKCLALKLWESSSCCCSSPTAASAGRNPRPLPRIDTGWLPVISGSFPLLECFHWHESC